MRLALVRVFILQQGLSALFSVTLKGRLILQNKNGVLGCRGVYYWRKATRTEQIQVKIVVADDETSSEVVVQGDDEQIDRMRRELELMEKGMVYVKGILEQ